MKQQIQITQVRDKDLSKEINTCNTQCRAMTSNIVCCCLPICNPRHDRAPRTHVLLAPQAHSPCSRSKPPCQTPGTIRDARQMQSHSQHPALPHAPSTPSPPKLIPASSSLLMRCKADARQPNLPVPAGRGELW